MNRFIIKKAIEPHLNSTLIARNTIYGTYATRYVHSFHRRAIQFSCLNFLKPIYVSKRLIWKTTFNSRKRFELKTGQLGLIIGAILGAVATTVYLSDRDLFKTRSFLTLHAENEKNPDLKKLKSSKSKDDIKSDGKTNDDDDGDDYDEIEKKKVQSKIGFRERKIIEYENRLRCFSTPDKIFRYFATVKVIYDDGDSEVFMTPDDFLRSVTPGILQPDGLGLDKFRKIDLTKGKDVNLHDEMLAQALRIDRGVECGLKHDSIFFKLSSFGLINYSDFLFLLTVISVSHRHFEIAFRMFDLNGDGNVDYEEFEKVQNAILHQTSVGKKLGASVKTNYRGVSSALAKYFFGEKLDQKLTIEKFLAFQRTLQSEMLTLEFERKKPNADGKIKESDFGELLIAYAGFPDKKKSRMLKRVKKKFPNKLLGEPERGITLDDYLSFYHFLQNISDIDVALTFFNIAGAAIDETTLKHAAKTVAHVNLRDHLIDVIFTLFDENQDGQLSNREFISVMKERLRRGLARPKDTGFMKLLHAFWNSVKMDFF